LTDVVPMSRLIFNEREYQQFGTPLLQLAIEYGNSMCHSHILLRSIEHVQGTPKFHFLWRRALSTLTGYGLTRSTSGIGVSGAAVAISRLKRSVVPSNAHPPSLQREPVSIDFPSRTRSAFAVASRSAR
jgi:hypothetical protein